MYEEKREADKYLYKTIRKLCEVNNTSIFALEKKLGFGNGTISRWDNSSPTVAKLKMVADFFGVTMEELLSQEEPEEQKVG